MAARWDLQPVQLQNWLRMEEKLLNTKATKKGTGSDWPCSVAHITLSQGEKGPGEGMGEIQTIPSNLATSLPITSSPTQYRSTNIAVQTP